MDERHVRFDPLTLVPTVAHDGRGSILARRALVAADGIACNFIDLAVVPPGASIGVHTHDGQGQEIYVIIAGSGRVHVDGCELTATAGDVILNRPLGTHGVVNAGHEPLKMVVIEVPVETRGFEAEGTLHSAQRAT